MSTVGTFRVMVVGKATLRLQAASSEARHEAASAQRRLEAARRELASVKAAHKQSEATRRGAKARSRAEAAAEVHALTTRLEDTIAAYNTSLADADRVLAAKDGLLRRYKSEAQSMAGTLQSLQVRAAPAGVEQRKVCKTAITLRGLRVAGRRKSTRALAASCGADG